MKLLASILGAIWALILRLFRKPVSVDPTDPMEPDPDPFYPIGPEEPSDPTLSVPNVLQDYISAGRRNRPGYTMSPQYVTIHDTGNPRVGANAKAHASYLKGDTAANLPVSWHFTVDDKEVYQHLPLNENGWHSGDGNGQGNRASIGIEICENADGNRANAEENAALLVAWLHGEVETLLPYPSSMKQHFNWSGKNCPHIIRGRPEGWQGFLDSVPLKQAFRALED